MWWAFYLFSVGASTEWLNWSLVGAVFLTLLFTVPGASLDVTEALSSRKYAAYPEYQKRVSRFFPWPPAPAAAARPPASKSRSRAASPAKPKTETSAEKVVMPAKRSRARSKSPAPKAKSPTAKSPASKAK